MREIPSYRDNAQFFENPPNRLSLEQPNLNTKWLAKDRNVMGRPKNECLMSLAAYPAVQYLANPTPSCFSEAQVKSPGLLYKEILTLSN